MRVYTHSNIAAIWHNPCVVQRMHGIYQHFRISNVEFQVGLSKMWESFAMFKPGLLSCGGTGIVCTYRVITVSAAWPGTGR